MMVKKSAADTPQTKNDNYTQIAYDINAANGLLNEEFPIPTLTSLMRRSLTGKAPGNNNYGFEDKAMDLMHEFPDYVPKTISTVEVRK